MKPFLFASKSRRVTSVSSFRVAELPPTFVDLPHDGDLQVLPVVLLAVEPKQNTAHLDGQSDRRHHVDVTERAQTARQLLHRRHVLLGVLEAQDVDDWRRRRRNATNITETRR